MKAAALLVRLRHLDLDELIAHSDELHREQEAIRALIRILRARGNRRPKRKEAPAGELTKVKL